MSFKLLMEDGDTYLGWCCGPIEQTHAYTSQSSGLECLLLYKTWNEEESRTVPHIRRARRSTNSARCSFVCGQG